MLSEALTVPQRGDRWLERIGIGGLLMFGAFLIFPIFILYGYYLQVLRAGSEATQELPPIEDWGSLFVDGLKVLAVSLVYFLVPAMITMFLLFTGVILANGGDSASILGIILLPIVIVVWLLAGFLLPAALTNVAREGSLGAATDVGTITSGAFTVEYLIAWVLAQIVSIVLGGIALILSLVLVGIFVSFYTYLVMFYLLGRGFGAGLGVEASADPASIDSAAG